MIMNGWAEGRSEPLSEGEKLERWHSAALQVAAHDPSLTAEALAMNNLPSLYGIRDALRKKSHDWRRVEIKAGLSF